MSMLNFPKIQCPVVQCPIVLYPFDDVFQNHVTRKKMHDITKDEND